MICRAIPYEGNEPYVFLSYCHKDRDFVYPLLEQMVRDGYRVWYDDGNHAGDDWLENIANHLNNCKVFLAMISEKSANSHNCRNEISFAIECGKKVLAVVMENFRMPIGMRLQLGTIHYLKKQDYLSDHMLLSKLYETSDLAECKTTPGSLPMRESSAVSASKEEYSRCSAVVSGFLKTEKMISGKSGEVTDLPGGLPSAMEDAGENTEFPTIFQGVTQADDGDDESTTILATQGSPSLVIRLRTGEAFVLQPTLTRIGRSFRLCNIILADNEYIGNCHAEIIQYKNRYYLRDRGSANGTFINGKKLSPEDSEELVCNTLFKLHDEYFLFIDDERAEQIITGKIRYYLRCTTTQGIMLLQEGDVFMDRYHKWEDGTLKDDKISRKVHAVITYEAGKLSILDLGSRNGTFVNGPDIRGKGSVTLCKGDRIRLGDTFFEVGVISL